MVMTATCIHRMGDPAALQRPAALHSKGSSGRHWRLVNFGPSRCALVTSMLFVCSFSEHTVFLTDGTANTDALVTVGRRAADAWHRDAAGRPHRSWRRCSRHAGGCCQ
jgi:hypothetical protein